MERPEVRYAQSGDLSIAYQVAGAGPIDLVFVPFLISSVFSWIHPVFASFYEHLASFSRLILLDKRGIGASDRPRTPPTLEAQMDDVRAVLDAVGSVRRIRGGWGRREWQTQTSATSYRRFAYLCSSSIEGLPGTSRQRQSARLEFATPKSKHGRSQRQFPTRRVVAVDGRDASPFVGDEIPIEVERFLREPLADRGPDRVLATILFTDIVGSTERAASLGDRAWRELLAAHRTDVRRELARFNGTEIDTAGDGFFASFDGRHAVSRAQRRSSRLRRRTGYEFAPDFIPANASERTGSSPESPFTSAPGSPRSRSREKCSSPAQ